MKLLKGVRHFSGKLCWIVDKHLFLTEDRERNTAHVKPSHWSLHERGISSARPAFSAEGKNKKQKKSVIFVGFGEGEYGVE